jgi:two-component system sensor histidine kinase and response regulator WspE
MSEDPFGQIDESLLELFRTELEIHVRVLEDELVGAELEASAERIEKLMRAAHSLKGAARIVGVATLADLSHQMENVFIAVQEGRHELKAEDVDVLLEATGLLTKLAGCELAALGERLAEEKGGMLALADRVEALLKQGGGLKSDEQAAGIPETSLEDMSLLDIFKVDLETHSRALEQGLLALEVEGNHDAVIESLMRAAHSIKGSSRIAGLDAMGELAHGMEDVMLGVQRGERELDGALVDLLLQGNDLFKKAAAAGGSRIEALVREAAAEYRDLTGRISGTGGAELRPPGTAAATRRQMEKHPAHSAGCTQEASQELRPPEGAAAAAGEDARTVRVQADSLSRLMGLAGEFLVEARGMKKFSNSLLRLKNRQRKLGSEMEHCAARADEPESLGRPEALLDNMRRELDDIQSGMLGCIERYETFSRRLEQLSDRLYGEVITSRMRPFADGLHGFARMVRDIARQLGREVTFCVEGGETPVDRDILERMEAPLTHLLRNAVDHGLEEPDAREQAGKPRQGRLVLNACHRAGMLHIVVRDDGRGVDLQRLRTKAVDRGHVTEEMAQQLSEEELLQFLFLPGFSTAEKVTDISGRGVGLDVVHAMVREVGGHVSAQSLLGKGTAFHLELPLTLSVIRALVVLISGQQFAVPLSRIDRVLRVPDDQIDALEERRFFQLEQEQVGLVPAAQVLELPVSQGADDTRFVLVISDALNRYGLEVDELIGQRDLVVLPLDARLGKIPDVSAGAVREDGTPLLILDVDDLVRSIDHLLVDRKPGSGRRSRGEQETGRTLRVLVVDDSLTVREVERKLLTGNGYEVEVAVDGMDGWNRLQAGAFDLVVTDVDMPRMNGIELVEQIRAVPRFNDLPVMIVSYKDREEDRLRGLRAGADYYLTKSSFHDERLIEAVTDLIGPAK